MVEHNVSPGGQGPAAAAAAAYRTLSLEPLKPVVQAAMTEADWLSLMSQELHCLSCCWVPIPPCLHIHKLFGSHAH